MAESSLAIGSACTSNIASSTVEIIGVGIDATAVADGRGGGGATGDAFSVGADHTGFAFIVAFAAVVEVSVGIDAYSVAVSFATGAEASSTDANFTTGTFMAASTAVIDIGVGVDAASIADGGSGAGAAGCASIIGANVSFGAGFSTLTAIVEIVSEIFADAVAVG